MAPPRWRPVQAVALPPNPWNDTVVLGLGGRVLRPAPGAWEVKGGARRPVWDGAGLGVRSRRAIRGHRRAGRLPSYPQDRTLFAATSAGVYVSRDGGASFARWSDGLEPTATVVVAPSPAYARIGWSTRSDSAARSGAAGR